MVAASVPSPLVVLKLLAAGANPFLVSSPLPDSRAARSRYQLRLLLAGCAQGAVFSPALYDPALWRIVRRFM
jgi:hypothetical protein